MEELMQTYKPKVWGNMEECYPNWRDKKQKVLGIRWVDVDKIVGTVARIDKFWKERFIECIKLVQTNKYNFNWAKPPVLFKIRNEYFVTTDGNHRVLAFKFLELKRIKAKVVELV